MKNKILTFIIISFIFILDVSSLFAQSLKIKDEIAAYTKNLPFSINEFNIPTFSGKKYNIVELQKILRYSKRLLILVSTREEEK